MDHANFTCHDMSLPEFSRHEPLVHQSQKAPLRSLSSQVILKGCSMNACPGSPSFTRKFSILFMTASRPGPQ